MTAETRDILLNRDVIAVDQDPLGQAGHRVAKDGDRELWVCPLAGGARAVLLFNRGATAATITATWDQLQLPSRLTAMVRDLWAHRDLPRASGHVAATGAPYGVVMLKVRP